MIVNLLLIWMQGALGRCKNCVYVMERIKQGYHYLLPNICEEVMAKTKSDDEYATVRVRGTPCH